MTSDLTPLEDAHDRRRVRSAEGLLREANLAGLLMPADVHVAARLGRLGGETDEHVLLAAALTVRAVRLGSVCVDLATVAETAPGLSWPSAAAWRDAVAQSHLVSGGVLHEHDGLLYLERYWSEETQVCEDLLGRRGAPPPDVDRHRLREALMEHFPGDGYTEQRAAAEMAARQWTSVITGGPGTGKTTTIARFLGALQAASD
ncbi:MAG: AAA family ATPase, partial [Actinomycetota bacterium]|nr:AAA family ATPase [Actinomycetota bacterium]